MLVEMARPPWLASMVRASSTPPEPFDIRATARIARRVADRFSTVAQPRFVLGSMGPGTKLPTLGHVKFTALRDAYAEQTAAMIEGGIDAVGIETCQDLLQAQAAVIGARRAAEAAHVDLPIFVSVTVETTGAMLLGSEIGAALATLLDIAADATDQVGAAEEQQLVEQLTQRLA